MRQVAVAEWPKGLEFPLAMIPDEVVPSLGLHFEAYEEEGLGLHFAAIVRGEAGVFALLRGVRLSRKGHAGMVHGRRCECGGPDCCIL